MFNWSEPFNTNLETVDAQHKRLVEILDKLSIAVNKHHLTQEQLDEILKELTEYTIYHFSEEEKLMEEYSVSKKHVSLHKMEHHSFTYDIDRMCNYFSEDMTTLEIGEKLVLFVAAWLTYHILGMDKLMGYQIEDIKRGIAPEISYENHSKPEFDFVTTKLLLDAVLKMWQQCNEHSLRVEEYLKKINAAKHSS